MNLPDKWKTIYRPMTDEELCLRAERAGWVYLNGQAWGGMKDCYGWSTRNSLINCKKGGNAAEPLRAKQREWNGNTTTHLCFEHVFDCSFCGLPISFDTGSDDAMLESKQCWICNHWHTTLKSAYLFACERSDYGCNFHIYQPGDERGFRTNSNGSLVGFGGAEVCLLKPDGEIRSGNNLWHLGEITDQFIPLVKNFAVLRWGKPESIPEVERGFLAAIKASPNDSLPLLVYADWLDENERPKTANVYRKMVAA